MDEEYNSLMSNDVWELVKLPKDERVLSSKWIFKCKIGATGNINRYKARLVAQGYSQRPGVDYTKETISPVVRFESLRMIAALAAQNNLQLHQMDELPF
uniref:Reverse transcriptase Ty1/copia-type domain-containing protein n=1 Tax=Amphimedon queenslandica TaxID=400682 RepID=A0A1X7TBP1_AMPQE